MGEATSSLPESTQLKMSQLKLAIAGALVAICILSFDSAEGACLNCEAPYGPYCCKTSFRGQCCEYPLDDRAAKNYASLTPLERQVKSRSAAKPPPPAKKTPTEAESKSGSISSPF